MNRSNQFLLTALSCILLSLSLPACLSTSERQRPSASTDPQTANLDDMAVHAIDALARRDRAGLLGVGMSESEIESAFKASPKLASNPDPGFLMDFPIADRYARQYTVELADSQIVEVRVWFEDSDEPRVSGFQFLESSRQ